MTILQKEILGILTGHCGTYDAAIELSHRIDKLVKEKFTSTRQITPCPCCGDPWDMSRNNACQCGAVLKQSGTMTKCAGCDMESICKKDKPTCYQVTA